MEGEVTELFNVLKFPTSQRLYTMEELLERAIELSARALAEHVQRAIAHDRWTLDIENMRRTKRGAKYGEDAILVNNKAVRGITGGENYLDTQMRVFPPGHPRHEAAARARKALYPLGAGAITSLPYVQQHAMVSAMLEKAKEPEVARDLAVLPDAEAILDGIRQLNDEHGEVLDSYERVPSAREARAARKRGHRYLVEAIALIIARHVKSGHESTQERDYLLEPIWRQNEAVKAMHRSRRASGELDLEPAESDEGADFDEGEAEADQPAA